MNTFRDRIKASFFAALVAAVCMYSYLLLATTWAGLLDILPIVMMSSLIVSLVAFVVGFFVAYLLLFFISPLCQIAKPGVSLAMFMFLGAAGGFSVIMLFAVSMPRFADEAMKSYWGMFWLSLPYSVVGAISAAAAWYVLIQCQKGGRHVSN